MTVKESLRRNLWMVAGSDVINYEVDAGVGETTSRDGGSIISFLNAGPVSVTYQ